MRASGGYFAADDDDAQSTITWGGTGYSHKLAAISVQRAVSTCQTGCGPEGERVPCLGTELARSVQAFLISTGARRRWRHTWVG